MNAGRDAAVSATAGSITETVSAGHNADVFASGDIHDVAAGLDVSVLALGNINGAISGSGGDADVFAGGNLAGSV